MDDHWPNLHADKYAQERLRKSCELLQVSADHHVLDVGCHKGEAYEILPPCNYTGLDALFNDQIDGGFMLLEKFDRILCLEVLEHLQRPQKTLASIAQHLDDSGLCVISLPNEATLFHRIRSLLGTVDAEAFSESGKHLHLPNLRQARAFVSQYLQIVSEEFYIAPSACSSRQAFLGNILKLIPDRKWQTLASFWPSLFARGFIFLCKKKQGASL